MSEPRAKQNRRVSSPRGFASATAALILCFAPCSHAFAQTPTVAPAATPAASASVERTEHHIARGVDVIQEITPPEAPGGPLLITIVEVDPKTPGVRLEAALGQDRVWGLDPTFGREIVSKLVSRHKAVAGINAGFFPFAGNPIGLHVSGGDLVTEPANGHMSFYITRDGTTGFARFHYKGTAHAVGGGTDSGAAAPQMGIDGLNRKPGGAKDVNGELLLYTPVFLDQTLATPGRVEAVLSGVGGPLQPNHDYVGTVTRLTVGGETPIARNTIVLSGIGPGADFLNASAKPGAKISFRLDVSAADPGGPDPAKLAEVVSGGSELLEEGKNVALLKRELFGTPMSTTGHPRTAIGRKPDGKVLLVTVDGRQKGLSHGAPLPDLALIMQRFGATDAINMDGGGSSSEVLWDSVASSPSEGIERPIADALLVYADDLPRSPIDRLPSHLNTPDHPLKIGESWNFATKALAENEHAAWGARGGEGFISQAGVFQARREGKGLEIVTVTLGSRSRALSASFSVVGASTEDAAGFAAKLNVQPSSDASPTHSVLTIHIANAEGDPLANEPVAIEVTAGTPDKATVTTNSHGDATMGITWYTPITNAPRTIKVTSPQKRFSAATLTIATAIAPGG